MDHRVLINILRISRCSASFRRKRITAEDIAPSQHLYISYACRHPGYSQEQFSRHFCIDKSTVARQLQALERDGYIERRPSEEDGRMRLIYPTQKAEMIYPEIHKAFDEFTEALIQNLSEKDIEDLIRLTGILVENASEVVK